MSGCVLARKVLLEHLHVLSLEDSQVVVVADQHSRLNGMDHPVLFAQFPCPFNLLMASSLVPDTVEPDASYRPVVGQKFGQLRIHEVEVTVPVSFLRSSRRTAGVASRIVVITAPVEVRIVEIQLEPLFGAGLREFLQDIPPERSRIHNVVRRGLRREHRESVVICPGFLEEFYPFLRIEA